MKKSVLYLFTLLAAIWIVGNSNSSGPGFVQGADRTGSPIGESFCGDCHSSGRYNTSLQITLLKDSTPVTAYEPGKNYTLQVKVVAGSGTPAGFGYQATVLAAGSNAQAGTLSKAPADQRVITLGGRQYAEHRQISNANVFRVSWTAPARGTGPVNVYAAGIAANGEGSSGDGAAKNVLTLTETTTTGLEASKVLPAHIKVFPNPSIDFVTVEIKGELKNPTLSVDLLDGQGRTLQTQRLPYPGQAMQVRLDLKTLPHGAYWVRVSDGDRLKTVSLIK